MDTIQEIYKLYLECNGVVSTDSRRVESGSLFFALKGDNFDGNDYAQMALERGAKYAIVSKQELAQKEGCHYVEDTLTALQRLATYHRKQCHIPIVGITGTNGKTTTKELLAGIMQNVGDCLYTEGNLNNHIGVPLTLLRLQPQHTSAIIEMGASKRGDIKELVEIAHPTMGVITNIGKAHLQGFGSQEGILATKSELFDFLSTHNHPFVLNHDDSLLSAKWSKGYLFSYGTKPVAEDSYIQGEVIDLDPYLTIRIRTSNNVYVLHSHLVGSYNLYNILAAFTIAMALGVDPKYAIKGIESYHPSNHRSQLIIGKEDKRIIADAYNANPSSMIVALQNLLSTPAKHKIAILGDMKELGDDSRYEHQAIINWLSLHPDITPLLCGSELSNIAPHRMAHFDTSDDLLRYLEEESVNLSPDTLILLKGSHSTALERVLPILRHLIGYKE